MSAQLQWYVAMAERLLLRSLFELSLFPKKLLSVIGLGNPKLTVGSTTEFVEAKTTLTQALKMTLKYSAPLG
jgi:hypothetical protein